jgi:Ca2+-transporting ATPase
VLIVLGTELGILQRILETAPLTVKQWLICFGVASSLLVVEEVTKFVLRARSKTSAPSAASTGEEPSTRLAA